MSTFAHDLERGRRYLPALKRILGQHLIVEAPDDDDRKRNTDLIVLRLDAVRIACRVRSRSYYESFGHEFTVRAGRPTGAKTELHKIIMGWGNFFLYAFADERDPTLYAWTLCDLNEFRSWFARHMALNRGTPPGVERANKDGSSTFRVFRWADLPPAAVVASGAPGTDVSWLNGEPY